MKTKLFVSLAVITVLVIVGVFVFQKNEKTDIYANSPLNAQYKIDRQLVRLVNGRAETESAPGSASKIITSYFGNEVRRDFDGDGREDSVFLLTQDMGGSGTFFYVVPVLNTADGYVGGEALFLGDRIAPQTTEMSKNDIIVVNYADRAPTEGFDVPPSIGKSIWLKLDPQTLQFGEVVQDFEGEADPSKMTLGMKSWNWVSTYYNDGAEIKPNKEGIFVLTFNIDGRFSLKTDCNSVAGKYSVNPSAISFTQMVSTKMYCENSQETQFTEMLKKVRSYLFTSKRELVLELAYDSGGMIFK